MEKYPQPTSKQEKMEVITNIKDRLLLRYGEKITAIGVYGSIGKEIDGPFSDIEMHVIIKEPLEVSSYEFVYRGFKVEVDLEIRDEILKEAQEVDDMWPIKTGSFTEVLPIYDPGGFFEELKGIAANNLDENFKPAIRQFIIDEAYETMGKIRNAWVNGNSAFIRFASRDILWETAKLLGLANKKYYSTRSSTIDESLKFSPLPEGYRELALVIQNGDLNDVDKIYEHCENLWTGINKWAKNLKIDYMLEELPF